MAYSGVGMDREHQLEEWLRCVAAAWQSGEPVRITGGITVRQVTGGFNNALYRIETGDGAYVCKLCVPDGRDRAAREFGALRLLQALGLDLAPEPVLLDESCTLAPFPAVIYRWLPGIPLRTPLTGPQLYGLLDSLQRLHAVRPDGAEIPLHDGWFHRFDFSFYLEELAGFLADYGPWLEKAHPQGSTLRDRLAQLIGGCREAVANTRASPARTDLPLCMVRTDANLANTVWTGDGCVRWVDWEYTGWGDPALDLADVLWHASLAGLTAAQWRWLRETYERPGDDPAFEARFAVWERIMAARWPFLILRTLRSFEEGPDRVRLGQAQADPAELWARVERFIARAERPIR
jgi:Ser/Thr protein kinase RdoA (MazF antagonist)